MNLLYHTKTTIENIVNFYDEHPECIGKMSVDTQHGFKKIEYADITAYDSKVLRVECHGDIIEGSPDHLLMGENGWEKIQSLTVGSRVLCRDGFREITSISTLPETEDLMDLQVEGKQFYANNFVSHNSTILDALCFSLFGKAYRNINKPQLVNSINNKQCLVEIEFEIGAKKYMVRRGVKPVIFEIYIDGKAVDQSSASKDYQKYLEENILKMNYSGFTQVVILGAASFVPFMKLPAAQRREIIESFLDIKIFSQMKVLLKQKQQETKDGIKDISSRITLVKEKTRMLNSFIESAQKDRVADVMDNEERQSKTRFDLEALENEQSRAQERLEVFVAELAELKDHNSQEMVRSLSAEISALKKQLDANKRRLDFFQDNQICPTCEQPIGDTIAETVHAECGEEIRRSEDEIQKHEAELVTATAIQRQISAKDTQIAETRADITRIMRDIEHTKKFLKKLQEERTTIDGKTVNIDAEKQKLRVLAAEGLDLSKEHSALKELQHYYDVGDLLLKDSGIKTLVTKKYLPIINSLVNKYLGMMDLFVQFNLDDRFNEVIKSRHRDEFSYESFSQGEKQRIDLALLFTWRAIAKLRNSTNTNLLILDEVFDSSLDAAATESVIGMLNSLGADTNVFVISHKGDTLFDKFSQVIRVRKKNNFTTIK